MNHEDDYSHDESVDPAGAGSEAGKRILRDAFGITGLPADWYSNVLQWSSGAFVGDGQSMARQRWKRWNHFDLSETFPLALVDVDATRAATLACRKEDLYGHFAHLDVLIRGLPAFSQTEAFERYYTRRLSREIRESMKQRNDLAYSMLERLDPLWPIMSDEERLIAESRVNISMLAAMNANLNQKDRQAQEEFEPFAIASIKALTSILSIKFPQYVYSLRPMLTMNRGAKSNLDSRSPLIGIANVQLFQTETQNQLQETLRLNDLEHVLNIGTSEWITERNSESDMGLSTAVRTQRDYTFWTQLNAYAIAHNMEDRTNIAVTPLCTPPWLLFTGIQPRLPIYHAYPTHGMQHDIEAVHFQLADTDFRMIDSSPESAARAQDVGQLILILCLLLTALATTARMGTGHRLPKWSKLPMNQANLRLIRQLVSTTLTAFDDVDYAGNHRNA